MGGKPLVSYPTALLYPCFSWDDPFLCVRVVRCGEHTRTAEGAPTNLHIRTGGSVISR
jgi:hypothetical protein